MLKECRTFPTKNTLIVILLLSITVVFLLPHERAPLHLDVKVENKTHSLEKHGVEAEIARKCLEQKGGYIFLNDETKRIARCNFDDETGKWAIQICENCGGIVEEVTAFLKNKLPDFDKVISYLKNRGYTIQK